MGALAVFLAAAAGYGAGAVWFMVLGRVWMAAVGRTEDEIRADRSALPFVLAFAANLLTAGMLRHVFAMSGVEGLGAGLVAGLGTGLFLAAPWIVTAHAFSARPRTLWWLDAGHVVLAATVIGTVLGAMA